MTVTRVTKKHAITRGHLGCLGDVATVNLARGCAGRCAFCFARCIAGAPTSPGQIALYSDLASQLRGELERRRRPPPRWVLFSTASDPFIGPDELVELARGCLATLLEHNIAVSLSTRGDLPDEVVTLLASHASRVRVTIPLTTLSEEYTATWEPGAAPPRRRLFALQRLIQAEVPVVVRVEPIIPFVNDGTESLRALFSAVAGLGLSSAMVSFLHLRPGVREQLLREGAADQVPLLLGSFLPDEPELALPRGRTFEHLPARQRLAGLRRVQRIARERGVRASACQCQNPGLPSRQCPVRPPELPRPSGTQLELL